MKSYLDDVDTILFCSSLDGYHQINESNGVSQLQQDLDNFRMALSSITHGPHIILIFTKLDLLENTLHEHPPQQYFDDFFPKGKDILKEFKDYIYSKFVSIDEAGYQPLSPNYLSCHFVNTLDRQLMHHVGNALKDCIFHSKTCCRGCSDLV